MSDADYLHEHRLLLDTLTNPTKKKLVAEKARQLKELKEFNKK